MRRYFSRASALFIGLIVFLACAPHRIILPTELRARVVGVKDGDTITILHQRRPLTIRVANIDCPELRQPFGSLAKQLTSQLVFGKMIRVEAKRRDRYGRIVGLIILDDGQNLSEQLVKAGLAWWYRKYSTDEILMKLEAEARSAKRELWIDPNAIPPWEFRKER